MPASHLYYRHTLTVRVTHWVNAAALAILFMSGLNIFSAHPALYWGKSSYTGRGPVLEITARQSSGGAAGITRVLGREFVTTGVLGSAAGPRGEMIARTFPSWLTLPASRWLAMARRWHFFFAWAWVINGVLYLAWSLASRHLRRDLAMQRRDWRAIPRTIADHLRFRHPLGDAAARYNPLQKLAYLGVIFVLAPLIILTGLAMSPQLDTIMGWFLQLVGGRQSARTLHFAAMALFVLFTIVHVVMVVYAGPVNEMRSMITGRFRVRYPKPEPTPTATGEEPTP